jgi:hypothetical protein
MVSVKSLALNGYGQAIWLGLPLHFGIFPEGGENRASGNGSFGPSSQYPLVARSLVNFVFTPTVLMPSSYCSSERPPRWAPVCAAQVVPSHCDSTQLLTNFQMFLNHFQVFSLLSLTGSHLWTQISDQLVLRMTVFVSTQPKGLEASLIE